MSKQNDLTEAEWAIIRVVWDKQPCPAGTVQEELHSLKSWSYSTVKTLMDRMVEKGLLKGKKLRNLVLYEATLTKPQAQKNEFTRMLKYAFNGAFAPMMQFLLDHQQLSDSDFEELSTMIQKKRKKLQSK